MLRKGDNRVKLFMVRHPLWMPAECKVLYLTPLDEAANVANGYDCEEIPTVYFEKENRK